jgi:hypothetical protein
MDIITELIKSNHVQLFEFSDAIKTIKYTTCHKYLTCEHNFQYNNFSINNSYGYICYKCGYATKYLV